MTIRWITPAGSLGILVERVPVEIIFNVESDANPVTFTLLSGSLPRGLRLENNKIVGSPTEVKKFTTSRFVIRAADTADIEDRTFNISVDGSDIPEWITEEGFLKVGQGENYFVLDNAKVDFQLDATDTDLIAGDTLEFYLIPNGGQLPPGLTLSKQGKISGFTEPIFSIIKSNNYSGAYDSAGFDVLPLDRPATTSVGYDSFFFDNTTFDYFESNNYPNRLSRLYSFVIAITDGLNEVRRAFRMWVVTDEFLKSDNSLIAVDTNLFRADNTSNRIPIWITDSYLGRYRANNYITIFLDVYDPPTLSGTISYLLLPNNPDGSPSVLPPGMVLDQITGEIAGRVGYQAAVTTRYNFTLQAINYPLTLGLDNIVYRGNWNKSVEYFVNDSVVYSQLIYICVKRHTNRIPTNDLEFWRLATASTEKTFSVDIIGEIDSSIEWLSDSFLGEIKPNKPSRFTLMARSFLYGGRVTYELTSGILPPGLILQGNGDINGKVKQFADSQGLGITRFYEKDSSTEDSTGSFNFDSIFDNNTTTFDKVFTFSVKARDALNFAEVIKEFSIKVITESNTKTFANLYLKAFQSKEKRLQWYDFITDNEIFRDEEIYRLGDVNFGIQNEIKVLLYAGIESVEAVKFVQAMSRNHYNKRIKFGNLKSAVAKDPETQEIIYEVIYVEISDEYQKNGNSISNEIELKNNIESKVLISYDSIKVDSDIPLVSDSDHQRIFPNSLTNMRDRIKSLGERDREFLPLWMRSIQSTDVVETGYLSVLPICYAKPGFAAGIISRIKSSGFDFKTIDFLADRYLIDVLEGEIENKYLAFPQRGEKLP